MLYRNQTILTFFPKVQKLNMEITKPSQIKNLKELKISYDNLYKREVLRESPDFYRWVIDILSPEPGKTLLDIACGAGYLLKEVENLNLIIAGLDISEVALRIAKGNTSINNLICGVGEALPFKSETFDYLTNLGSLEHFLDPEKGVKEMARVLKNNGKCIIFVPNSYFLMTIINVWKTGSTGRKTSQELDRWATKNEWISILEDNGLKVEKIFKYNYKTPKDSLKYKIIRPFIPFNLSYAFLFVCRKK